MTRSPLGQIPPQSPLGRLLVGMASQLSWHRAGRISPAKDDFELAGVIWDHLNEAGVTMQSLSALALGLGETMSHWYLTGVLVVEKCVFGAVPNNLDQVLNERGVDLPNVDASIFADGFPPKTGKSGDNPLTKL